MLFKPRYLFIVISLFFPVAGVLMPANTHIRRDIDEVEGNKIKDVTFYGHDNAWILTSENEIYRTSNGGIKWRKFMPGRVADFDCFYFTDSHVGWAANAKGEIWHTSDGGENWSIIGILHLRSITFTPFQLFFVDRLSGWLVGLWSVYHTIDGGITWQIEEPSGIKSIPRWSPHKCYFIDKKRGWVAASEGKVFETKDGGKKWNLVLNIDSGQDEDLYTMLIGRPDFRDILFLNGQTGWIIGNPNGGIFGTGDGGRSWKLLLQQVNDANQIVTSISFVDNREGWAVGNKSALTRIKPPFESKGVVLHTSDGGVKWDLVQVGRDEEVFQRVNFSSIADGWVVGKNRVYRTKDKGKRWNLLLDL